MAHHRGHRANIGDVQQQLYGGVIRDIKLLVVPNDHLIRFNIEADFDNRYESATLKVWAAIAFREEATRDVNLKLTSPDGKVIALHRDHLRSTSDQPEMAADIPVASPLKWDAEHPRLYTRSAKSVSIPASRASRLA